MKRERNHGLDALRTLAIIGMMAAHTARLVTAEARPGWLQAVLLYEPLIPSLFLFLVGVSLVLSLKRASDSITWYLRQVKRAAMLWFISTAFFAVEHGLRLPDMLTASGILANIAYAIVIVATLLILPRKVIALSIACVTGAALFVWLDLTETPVFALTTGNSPFLPLWLFAFVGALWGTMTEERGVPDLVHPSRSGSSGVLSALRASVGSLSAFVALALAALALLLIAHHGAEALFTKPLGRSDASRIMPASLLGAEALHVGYYNLRPLLALCCVGLQLGALVLLRKALGRLPESVAANVFALGRRALEVYVLHLALLAILVVAGGRHPLQEGWQGTAIWMLLVVMCMIYGRLRNKRSEKRYQPL